MSWILCIIMNKLIFLYFVKAMGDKFEFNFMFSTIYENRYSMPNISFDKFIICFPNMYIILVLRGMTVWYF